MKADRFLWPGDLLKLISQFYFYRAVASVVVILFIAQLLHLRDPLQLLVYLGCIGHGRASRALWRLARRELYRIFLLDGLMAADKPQVVRFIDVLLSDQRRRADWLELWRALPIFAGRSVGLLGRVVEPCLLDARLAAEVAGFPRDDRLAVELEQLSRLQAEC